MIRRLAIVAALVAVTASAQDQVTTYTMTNRTDLLNPVANAIVGQVARPIRLTAYIVDTTNAPVSLVDTFVRASVVQDDGGTNGPTISVTTNDAAGGVVRFSFTPTLSGTARLTARQYDNQTNDLGEIASHNVTIASSASSVSLSLVPLIDETGSIGTPDVRWQSINAVTGAFDTLTVQNLDVAGSIEALDTGAVRRAGDTMSGPITNTYGFFGDARGLTNFAVSGIGTGVDTINTSATGDVSIVSGTGIAITTTGSTVNVAAIQQVQRNSNDVLYASSQHGWTNAVDYPEIYSSLPTNDPDSINTFFDSPNDWTNWLPYYTNGFSATWTNGAIAIVDPETLVNRPHGWYRPLNVLRTNNWRATMIFTPGSSRFKAVSYSQVGLFFTNSSGVYGYAVQYHNNAADNARLYSSRHTASDSALGLATALSGDANPLMDFRPNNTPVMGLRITYTNGVHWMEYAFPRSGMPLTWLESCRVLTTNNNSCGAVGIYLLPYGTDLGPHYIHSFHVGSYP